MFSRKSNLMLEVAMIVLLLGSIPPIIGVPQDTAVWYFLNVAQWIAMALLIAQQAPTFSMAKNLVAMRALPLIFSAALVLMLTLYYGIYQQALSVVNAADKKANGQLLNGRSVSQYFRDTIGREGVMWDSAFRKITSDSAAAQLVKVVHDAIPRPVKGTAIFIPPENAAFWSLHANCHEKFNAQVSLTGQPSLMGGPPEAYGCDLDVYTSDYGTDFKSRNLSEASLCERARSRNLQQVLIVAGWQPSDRNRVIDCR